MYYTIRHVTRFRYSAPITESVMEIRMQPRSEHTQRSLTFNLGVSPRAHLLHYRDYQGNTVHHFSLPSAHTRLIITAEALVEVKPLAPLPERLPDDAWNQLDSDVNSSDYWDMLMPSQFARPTDRLHALAAELGLERGADPLTTLRELNAAVYRAFSYVPQSTKVDSPIDVALESRKGVCQDYSHIMIALVRDVLRVPARYVSGYLYHERNNTQQDRSAQDATHAWVEAWLPELGWTGFDPTNNLIAGQRHIRVAVGRDYADVPPTRGIFKGDAESDLSVSVQVNVTDEPPAEQEFVPAQSYEAGEYQVQQQQQQQQ